MLLQFVNLTFPLMPPLVLPVFLWCLNPCVAYKLHQLASLPFIPLPVPFNCLAFFSLITSTPPSVEDQYGNPSDLNSLPGTAHPSHHVPVTSMARRPADYPHHSNPSTFPSFSEALKFGVEDKSTSIHPPVQLPTHRPSLRPTPLSQGERSLKAFVETPLVGDEVLEPLPQVPKEPR